MKQNGNPDRNQRVTLTRQVWEHRADLALSNEDLREIKVNLTGFFSILAAWRAEENDKIEHPREGGGRR